MNKIKRAFSLLTVIIILSSPISVFAANKIYVDNMYYDITKLATNDSYKSDFQKDMKDGGKVFIEFNGKTADFIKLAISKKSLIEYLNTHNDEADAPSYPIKHEPEDLIVSEIG